MARGNGGSLCELGGTLCKSSLPWPALESSSSSFPHSLTILMASYDLFFLQRWHLPSHSFIRGRRQIVSVLEVLCLTSLPGKYNCSLLPRSKVYIS